MSDSIIYEALFDRLFFEFYKEILGGNYYKAHTAFILVSGVTYFSS